MRDKLVCPFCGGTSSVVVLSGENIVRPVHPDGYWRRRECEQCHQRFTTEEVVRTPKRPQHTAPGASPEIAPARKLVAGNG